MLGVVLHFTVAICIATMFYLLSLRIPALVTHPVIGGLGFGVAAYFVMGHIVVPLSRGPGLGQRVLVPGVRERRRRPCGVDRLADRAVRGSLGAPVTRSAARRGLVHGVSGMTGGTRGTTPPRRPISIDP